MRCMAPTAPTRRRWRWRSSSPACRFTAVKGMQTNLLGLDLDGLGRWLEGHGEKAFRAKQLAPWLHQR
ncbi:MAG: hypothetical protein ACO3T2_06905, partial [Burkholderiaceae bacterium]